MTSRKVGICKNVLVGGAIFAMFGWLALLSVNVNHILKKDNVKLADVLGLGRQKRESGGSSSSSSLGGATYIRWGRTTCPADAELVYSGYAGGQHYTQTGGGAGYVCLTDKPKYATYTTAGEATEWICGVELELSGTTGSIFNTANAKPNALHDSDVKCAVCQSTRPAKIMIPGTKECVPGWTMEYWGYLMTEHYTHKGRTEFACVDNAPESGSEGGAKNENGALMYHVQGSCGSLPCKPYVQGYELTCVVCTK
ncbi:uncharacterized protein LOC135496982 [Lineus longissimus]|uniref:uncharacterized protein LOC135496982 n=1 Tax=Lineus longissimus TaxID=88925 RepID=UPI00315D2AC5